MVEPLQGDRLRRTEGSQIARRKPLNELECVPESKIQRDLAEQLVVCE